MGLFLEDLAGKTEQEIKVHISENYAGEDSGFDYGEPTEDENKALLKELEGYKILIAYESVGSWGCDSSSYFLMQNKAGVYFEFSGGIALATGLKGNTTRKRLLLNTYIVTSLVFTLAVTMKMKMRTSAKLKNLLSQSNPKLSALLKGS